MRTAEEARRPARRGGLARRCGSASLWRLNPPRCALRAAAQEAALDAQVEEALACPCVADLKGSSCGQQFVTGAPPHPHPRVMRFAFCVATLIPRV